MASVCRTRAMMALLGIPGMEIMEVSSQTILQVAIDHKVGDLSLEPRLEVIALLTNVSLIHGHFCCPQPTGFA